MTKLLLACLAIGLASCAGTRAQRTALRELEPLPLPQASPAQPQPLSIAARQIDALTKLQPITP